MYQKKSPHQGVGIPFNTLRMFNTNPGSPTTGLVYDARVRLHFATLLIVAGALFAPWAGAQEAASLEKSGQVDNSQKRAQVRPHVFRANRRSYDHANNGLAQHPGQTCREARAFALKSDTRIERQPAEGSRESDGGLRNHRRRRRSALSGGSHVAQASRQEIIRATSSFSFWRPSLLCPLWRARPIARASGGTAWVITEPAPT